MQNKYKLPDYVRAQALAVVKSYEAYKRDVKNEENRILTLGGGRYETIGNERVYLPTGKGGSSSPTEDKAVQLEALHNSYKYKCIQAVEESLRKILLHDDPNYSAKVKKALLRACKEGRNFSFSYSDVDGLSRASFYRLKNQFLYSISVKMRFF